MTARSYEVSQESVAKKRRTWSELQPGGWGDRLAFGYMFRVLISVVAIAIPLLVVFVLGYFNDWQIHTWMLWFIGTFAGLTIAIGEMLRVGVYENRTGKSKTANGAAIGHEHYRIVPIEEYYGASGFATRLIDISLSIVMIVFLFPLLVAIATLVKFDSHGPVFYRSIRIGYHGKPFTKIYFRTTDHIEDAVKLGISSDIHGGAFTRAGLFLHRTGIRNLPSIFNVLGGSMSWIGVASLPEAAMHEVDENGIMPEYIKDRLEMLYFMKPGFININSEDVALDIPVLGNALRAIANFMMKVF